MQGPARPLGARGGAAKAARMAAPSGCACDGMRFGGLSDHSLRNGPLATGAGATLTGE